MVWKNLYINSQLIQTYTGKAFLIKLPSNGDYADYLFWHPAKCVHNVYNRRDVVSIGYTDDFTFKCFKLGKHYHKTAEVNLGATDIEGVFERMDSHHRENIDKMNVIHKPEKLNPIENPVADEELVDD